MPRLNRASESAAVDLPVAGRIDTNPGGDVPLLLWLQIESAVRQASRQLGSQLREENLSSQSFPILAHLPQEPDGIAAMLLCDITGSSPSSISELLQRMEREGLCLRRRNPRDARGTVVHISSAGTEKLHRAAKRYSDWLDAYLGQCSSAELNVLQRAAIILGDLPAID